MKVVTWNINGIRTAKKDGTLKAFLDSLEAEVICLQETKITRNLLTEDLANVDGYYAFFSFSRTKAGYSGVVTFCKTEVCPSAAEEGLTGILYRHNNDVITDLVRHYDVPIEFDEDMIKAIDAEGRVIITEHLLSDGHTVCILNVYCPCVHADNMERYAFKMNFNKCLEKRCKALIRSGKHVIVVGDMNISHRRIDHCEPDEVSNCCTPEHIIEKRQWIFAINTDRIFMWCPSEQKDFEKSEARQWFDNFLIQKKKKSEINIPEINNSLSLDSDLEEFDHGFEDEIDDIDRQQHCQDGGRRHFQDGVLIDLFREFHPEEKNMFTCWNTKSRARETNYGTRIDYILASENIAENYCTECLIRPDMLGSDHCPVIATMSLKMIQSESVPSLCACNMPEVCGKQQTINQYFTKKSFLTNASITKDVKEQSSLNILGSTGSQKRKLTDVVDNSNEKRTNKKTNLLGYFSKKTPATTTKDQTKTVNSNDDLWSVYGHDNSSLYVSPQSINDGSKTETKLKARTASDTKTSSSWKTILKGPSPAPLCKGHNEPTVLRTVKKEGANVGRQFYVCRRPAGQKSNKEADCGFFKWKT